MCTGVAVHLLVLLRLMYTLSVWLCVVFLPEMGSLHVGGWVC
jgi:hypothetical protein